MALYIFVLYIVYMYFWYVLQQKIFVQIKLHCPCVSMNCVIHRIPTTLRKPRFPSRTIFFPRGIYPNESHDATRTHRTLQL